MVSQPKPGLELDCLELEIVGTSLVNTQRNGVGLELGIAMVNIMQKIALHQGTYSEQQIRSAHGDVGRMIKDSDELNGEGELLDLSCFEADLLGSALTHGIESGVIPGGLVADAQRLRSAIANHLKTYAEEDRILSKARLVHYINKSGGNK